MSNLTMNNLVNCFEAAKENRATYVAVKVRMDGFPKDEVIINEYDNIDSKLEYYRNTYDKNLNHKYALGISIVGCTYGNFFSGIEIDFA